LAEIENRLHDGETMAVAAPTLVEAYAVLTRLPSPHRLSPADALDVLVTSFVQQGELVALEAASYRVLLQSAPAIGVAGGQTYDAVIAACARAAGVSTLLTFNERHFLPLAWPGLAVVVPRASSGPGVFDPDR
jgi:predicted nucleic acid-binding protein